MEFKVVTFNRKIAEEYLSRMATNRILSHTKVDEYAKAMSNGGWHPETAEFIKVDVNNNVNDGQHRLHAIIDSNTTIDIPVATGLPVDSQNFMDQGKSRNAGDVLTLNGAVNAGALTSIMRIYLSMQDKSITTKAKKGLQNIVFLEMWQDNKPFWNGVCEQAKSSYTSFNQAFPVSLIGGFIAYAKQYSYYKSRVDEFINNVFRDDLSHDNKAVVTFRRKMQLDSSKRDKINKTDKLRYLVRTYEKFVKNISTSGITLSENHSTIPR